MGGPLGASCLLRCADHDVAFAQTAVSSGALGGMVATPKVAELIAQRPDAPRTLLVQPASAPSELEAFWAAQREATVLTTATVQGSRDMASQLDEVRSIVALPDARPVVVRLELAACADLMDVARTAQELRRAGADATSLRCSAVNWDVPSSRRAAEVQWLLEAIDRFVEAQMPLVVEDAERLGPLLVAAGASGFTSAFPNHRPPTDGAGPSKAVGYFEPGTMLDVAAFTSAQSADVTACPERTCRALAPDRTRSDLRVHRLHTATRLGRQAESDPEALLTSYRDALAPDVRHAAEAAHRRISNAA